MYEIILFVINTGGFELADILHKIDTLWLQGDIDDGQRTELIGAAREKADPSSSYAPLQEQLNKLANELAALTARVTALEGGGTEPADEYPAYKQPTGAHDAYHNGDKVTYNGTKYICIAPDGMTCVWDPDTYPAYWQEVTGEATESLEEVPGGEGEG